MSYWQLLSLTSPKPSVPKRQPVVKCKTEEPEQWEIFFIVMDADTKELINGVPINLMRDGQKIDVLNSGKSGRGVVFFKQLDHGKYSVSVELPEGGLQSTYLQPPVLDDIPVEQQGRCSIVLHLRVQPHLVLHSVSHHFAPSIEMADFNYSIQGLVNETVEIEISSDNYPNNLMYARELTALEKADGSDKNIAWDGKVNGGGPLQDKYVNPLHAPYKVKLKCDRITNGETAEMDLLVLYHSIELQGGTYTADGNEPDRNAQLIRWVQYRLNMLGYFAGPVDGIVNNQLQRGIKRYTYAMPGLYGNDKTIDDHTNVKFQGQLADGDGARQILEDNSFPAAGEQAKAYIDHDHFNHGYNDFLNVQGHTLKDAAMLDRFEYPLEVKIYLLSRNDADGTGNGIDAEEAVGSVDIEWEVEDTPEDTNHLPVPGDPNIPSRTKNYVDAALAATRGAVGSDYNCPATNGNGQRAAAPNHNSNYFRIGTDLEPFTSQNVGGVVYSKAHADANANASKIGRAGILFRGSYIAGDTYKIKAKISFTRHDANNDQIAQSHTDLADKTNKTINDMLGAETGEIVLWRRNHIAAVVNWPDPNRDIDLDGIAEMYAHANCELDTRHATFNIEELFDTDISRDAYLDTLHGLCAMGNRDDMRFDNKGLYPFPLREQGPKEKAADYKIYVTNTIFGLGGVTSYFDHVAKLVYDQVSMSRTAGAIVLRPNLFAPVRVRRELPVLLRTGLFRTIEKHFFPDFYSGDPINATSASLAHGVTLLDNKGTGADKDKYLFTHEISHCRYLQHWEVPVLGGGGRAEEHDQNDHNCIMSYAEFIPTRPNLEWTKDSPDEPRFCGKCVLKLRGWDVRDVALPAQS